MNVWRCWRTTRWVVATYLMLLGFAAWKSIEHGHTYLPGVFSKESVIWIHVALISKFIAATAWVLGALSIGRDLSDNSGPFLLTRPRSRAYFVWSESGLALAELFGISAMTVGLYFAAIHFQLFTLLIARQGIAVATAPIASIAAPLVLLSAFLYAGLVYSVTYLMTALVRRNTIGLISAVGVFALYDWLSKKTSSFFALPDWMLDPFAQTFQYQLAPHLAASIAIRIGIILLLTYLSQFILERVEIRA
jgi:hypothetical protein